MTFTDIFIRRPVLATVVSLLILVLGLRAVFSLPVLQFPRTQNAVVTISTVYYGADADVVAGFISTPLENAVAQANGIDYITSTSQNSVSTITANLRLNYDYNKAMTEINTKVNSVLNQLPPGSQQPTISVEVGQTLAAMYIGFKSDILPQNSITDYLVRVVQPKLQAIEGVQTAEIRGGQNFALRAWLNPDKLAAYDLTAADVTQALAKNDYISGLGTTKGQMVQINLTASTGLHSLDEFRDLIVKQQNGAIVRLKDVANVTLGAEDYESRVGFDGKQAVYIGIQVTPSANLLQVIQKVRTMLPEIQAELPQGLTGQIIYDSTRFVNSSINEVIWTLIEALLIVTGVVFVFLSSARSVLITGIAIPLSLVGTFFIMLAFGFSINLLTLLALVLSIGLVVDDAIVVVENVNRHRDEGKTPMQSALLAGRELAMPIIAMTVVLVSVYIPIGFQSGLTGALFTEFAFTLVGAVTISAIVALTLTPMMCSKLLRQRPKGYHEQIVWQDKLLAFTDKVFVSTRRLPSRLFRWLRKRPLVVIGGMTLLFVALLKMEYAFGTNYIVAAVDLLPVHSSLAKNTLIACLALLGSVLLPMALFFIPIFLVLVLLAGFYYFQRERYETLLRASFNYLPVTVVFSCIVLGSVYFLYSSSRTELAPQEDQGVVIAASFSAPNATLQQRLLYSGEVYKDFAAFPETDHVFQLDMPGQSIAGMVLKPWDTRKRTSNVLAPLIQAKMSAIPGVQAAVFQPPPLPGSRGLPVQFVIASTQPFERINDVAQNFLQEAQKSGKFIFLDSDLKIDLPQARVDIDRNKAAQLGLTMNDVGSALSAMLGGGYVNYFSLYGRSYKVIPQVQQQHRLNTDQLNNYYIRTGDGKTVPLSTIADISMKVVPRTINHFQQMNAATISGVMYPGVAQGEALEALKDLAKRTLPEGYSIDYAGQSRQFVQESSGFIITFAFALIIIFLTLAAQFESFRDPITILISVPMAISGALLFITMGVGGASINIYTQVGLVTLMGLISKHGILIAEFANKLMEQGMSKKEAIITASGIRLRPIMMTTAAMVLGVVPLITASGAGALSRFNMGLVIAAGLTIGTLFTLFVHPAVVLMIAAEHHGHHDEEKKA